MKIVNPYFLHVFLRPIIGLADDDEAVEYYRQIELKSEDQYKAVIRDILIEPFKSLDEEKNRNQNWH